MCWGSYGGNFLRVSGPQAQVGDSEKAINTVPTNTWLKYQKEIQ